MNEKKIRKPETMIEALKGREQGRQNYGKIGRVEVIEKSSEVQIRKGLYLDFKMKRIDSKQSLESERVGRY